MTLHGDRPAMSGKDDTKLSDTSVPISPAVAPSAGTKRPGSPASPHVPKKAKSDGVSPKPSPVHSNPDRVRTVIEVLNAPRIDSPLPRSISAVQADKPTPEREIDTRRSATPPTSAPSPAKEKDVVMSPDTADIPDDSPAKESTPPVPLIQTDAAADAIREAVAEDMDAREAGAKETMGTDGDVDMAEVGEDQ